MKSEILFFLNNTLKANHYNGALVGISGGIDSAVTAALCVQVLGKENVFGLMLPERDSAGDTIKDSKLVCEFLGIKYKINPITSTLKSMGVYSMQKNYFFIPQNIKERYVKKLWNNISNNEDVFLNDLSNKGDHKFYKQLAYYRVKHRIRMCYLYLEAEKRNYAVVGTTNKTELQTGFYVKWGDDAVDIEPIMHLYKSEVYALAKELNIPKKIIEKAPSPDLIPGLTDEQAFGMSYKELDRILMKINRKISLRDEDPKNVKKVREIIKCAKSREVKILAVR